jgi:flavin reductase (DIM6/NTAB) family NADH-FMN oxidoreductase RutF
MELNSQDLTANEIYKILTGCVLPRPIAWVSSDDSQGHLNLAPFSFFTVASINPPVLCFSALIDDVRGEKDTLVNIRQTGEFVVNIVSQDLAPKMNQTSASYPFDVNEFEQARLTAQPSHTVASPGVAEAKVRFECRLRQVISLGSDSLAGNLVLGDIVHIHLSPEIYEDGRVDANALDAIGRLGGDSYATTRQQFRIARPLLERDR